MNSITCGVCSNANDNKVYPVKELQLGTRELFHYNHCAACGCMQLIDVPEDLGKYYPNNNYYSFTSKLRIRKKPDLLRKIKSSYLIYGQHRILGKLLSLNYKIPEYYTWMKNTGVQYDDPILDVGTGNGSRLHDLFKIGYTNLTGIDPFINDETHHGSVRVLKQDIYQASGRYSLVMLHHSFEHMDEPLKVLRRLKELLKPSSYILIRIPVMNMYGWKKYGVNWVGLDAPRHIFIHSLKSMEILAQQAGLELRKIEFDSGPYHMWASEQYLRDIPLMDPDSYQVNQKTDLFTPQQIEDYKQLAEKTNREGEGDQAAFYLFNKG